MWFKVYKQIKIMTEQTEKCSYLLPNILEGLHTFVYFFETSVYFSLGETENQNRNL